MIYIFSKKYIDGNKKIILAIGGSLGALSVNESIKARVNDFDEFYKFKEDTFKSLKNELQFIDKLWRKTRYDMLYPKVKRFP